MNDKTEFTLRVPDEFARKLIRHVEESRERALSQMEDKGWKRQAEAYREAAESEELSPAEAALRILQREVDYDRD